jgi:hypothetical protein
VPHWPSLARALPTSRGFKFRAAQDTDYAQTNLLRGIATARKTAGGAGRGPETSGKSCGMVAEGYGSATVWHSSRFAVRRTVGGGRRRIGRAGGGAQVARSARHLLHARKRRTTSAWDVARVSAGWSLRRSRLWSSSRASMCFGPPERNLRRRRRRRTPNVRVSRCLDAGPTRPRSPLSFAGGSRRTLCATSAVASVCFPTCHSD